MFKKILCGSALLLASLSTAFAGDFYLSPSITLINNSSQNGNFRGLEPRVAFGYDEMMSIYSSLSAEVFATLFSATLSENTPDRTSLKVTRSFGASVLPGYMINQNIMGYMRLGIISSLFTGPNTTRNGGQVGLGMQAKVDRSLGLRGEYTYTAYSSAQGIGAPKTDQVMVALVYYFN